MLLKEKALLFKDYVQPYHFLSHEKGRPETSSESLYGSSFSGCPTAKSDHSPIKRKRSYLPKLTKQRTLLSTSKDDDSTIENVKSTTGEIDNYFKQQESTESSSAKRDKDSSGGKKQKTRYNSDYKNAIQDNTTSESTDKGNSSNSKVKRDYLGESKKQGSDFNSPRASKIEIDSSLETRDDFTLRTSDTDIYNTKKKSTSKESTGESRSKVSLPSSPEALIRTIKKYKEKKNDNKNQASPPSSSTVKLQKIVYAKQEPSTQKASGAKTVRSSKGNFPLGHATSMEWDPFISHKHREKTISKQYPSKRQISPISEEGTYMSLTMSTSTDAHLGTDDTSTSSATFDYTFQETTRSPAEQSTKTTSGITSSSGSVSTVRTTDLEKSRTIKEKPPARGRPSKKDYTSLDNRYTNNK